MSLRLLSAPVLFLVLGALTTASAAQSAQQPNTQLPPGPRAPLFATPHGNGNIAAPEPQFKFHLPARILQPPTRIAQPPILVADQKCFDIRSYRFAANHAAEAPQLQSYSTCTPATGRELHPATEPPAANR